jgi:multidrug efflux pump subunit AcrA (membrane-fusion protein)
VKGSVIRRLRPIVLGAAAIAALAAAGCGEKSEPSVHPPTTAATTSVPTTTPTTPAPGTVTKTEQTPTAPVPKTTP